MKRLTAILRKKIESENLSQNEAGRDSTEDKNGEKQSTSPRSQNGRSCWLCGHETSLRFRLKDTNALCFRCFHTAYVALVLPIIDTPTRRLNDHELACKIEKLRIASDAESRTEVVDPAQAPFMGLSRFQNHLRQRTDITSKSEELDLSKEYRDDSNYAFLTPAAVNTCPLCGVDLPDLYNSELSSHIERSLCRNREMHIMWRCRECGAVSTIEGDRCQSCKKPRIWSCKYCTALHDTERSADGLRYCLTCGNYNTPEDILVGQVMLEKEQEMSKRVAVDDQIGSDTQLAGSVVFGVNDSGTLLELERQQEIEVNTYRLKCRLEKLELKCSDQKDDGNCLFASLAHQLFGNAHLHQIIRSCIVACMRENESDYRVFFNGKKEWKQYLSDMKKSGFWGDEICINAAARCFCVDIHVITSDATRWHLVFEHNELGSSKSKLRQKSPMLSTTEESGLESPPTDPHKDSSAADSVVCLFLVYKSPVHFNDIESSEALSIPLSDLLVPELYRIMQLEDKKGIPKSPHPNVIQKTSAAPMQSLDGQGRSKRAKNHATQNVINSVSTNTGISSEDGATSCSKRGLAQYTSGTSASSTLELSRVKGHKKPLNNAYATY